MSKTNDTPSLDHAAQDRELQDGELDAVSGGVVISINGILVGSDPPPTPLGAVLRGAISGASGAAGL
jgi:hypothetical protein